MPHTIKCANSTTPPKTCKCKGCGTGLHGVTHRITNFATVEQCVQQSQGEEVKEKVNEYFSEHNKEIKRISTHIQDVFVAKLTEEICNTVLSAEERKSAEKLKKWAKYHILCSLCAYLAKASADLDDIPSAVADNVAECVTRYFENKHNKLVTVTIRTILKKTVKHVVSKLLADKPLPPPSPNRTTMIRIFGIASCPDIEKHLEVEEHCLKPLLKELIKPFVENLVDANVNDLSDDGILNGVVSSEMRSAD